MLFANTVMVSDKSLVKVQVRVPASQVPTVEQSPPVASSDMDSSANASGSAASPIVKIPQSSIIDTLCVNDRGIGSK